MKKFLSIFLSLSIILSLLLICNINAFAGDGFYTVPYNQKGKDVSYSLTNKGKTFKIEGKNSKNSYYLGPISSGKKPNYKNGVNKLSDKDSKITTFYVGKGIKKISTGDLFSNSYNINKITVNKNNKYYSSKDGVLFNKNKTELVCYPPAKTGSYTIPSTVKVIKENAGLKGDVTIPPSVEKIEGDAFSYSAKTIKYKGTKAQFKKIKIVKRSIYLYGSGTSFANSSQNIVCSDGELTVKSTEGYPYKDTTKIKVTSNIKSSYTYSFNNKSKSIPITLKAENGKVLKNGKDYIVYYYSPASISECAVTKKPKNVGNYAIGIILLNDNYYLDKSFNWWNIGKGEKSGLYITPQTTAIKQLSKSKNSVKITWKKRKTELTGYQIQYSLSKDMKNAKTITVKNKDRASKVINKLKSNKKYYFRVRTYKTVKCTNKYGQYVNQNFEASKAQTYKLYSKWSKIKSVKV